MCLALGLAAPAAHAAPPAPITATTLDGAAFDLARERGHVVIVNFWATWCLPCRTEMPALDRYYRAHRAGGLAMLALSMDDRARAGAVRVAAAPYAFAAALGAEARIAQAYRPSQLPVTLVFAPDGTLAFDSRKHPGLMDQAVLDRVVGPLLAQRTDR